MNVIQLIRESYEKAYAERAEKRPADFNPMSVSEKDKYVLLVILEYFLLVGIGCLAVTITSSVFKNRHCYEKKIHKFLSFLGVISLWVLEIFIAVCAFIYI